MAKLTDSKKYVSDLFKKTRKEVLKKEVRSSSFFFMFAFCIMLGLGYFFGAKGPLLLGIILGGLVLILLVRFILKMILNKKYRESFLSFLAMEEYDDSE